MGFEMSETSERMIEHQVASWRLSDEPAVPLVVHDFDVIAHRILTFVKSQWHGAREGVEYETYVRAVWALTINRGPDCIPMMNARHIIVRDIKNPLGVYWRETLGSQDSRMADAWAAYAENKKKDLSEIPIAYKGNRQGPKPPDFLVVHAIGLAYCEEYFPVFGEVEYEADDWAGSISRINNPENPVAHHRCKFLHTIDRDWSQLVDEQSRLYWANTRYNPEREFIQSRLAGDDEVIHHTKYRTGFDITHPRELLGVKVLVGDMGDNLPPGTPEDYFTLLEANPIFNVDELPQHESLVAHCNNPHPNTRVDHFFNCVEGFTGMKLPFLTPLNGGLQLKAQVL
jgi:hypothetical protein